MGQSYLGPRLGWATATAEVFVGPETGPFDWTSSVVTGLTVDIGLHKNVDLNADLAYTLRTASISEGDSTLSFRLRYIDLGAFVKGKFGNKVKVYGMLGPMVSYGVGTREILAIESLPFDLLYERSFKEIGLKNIDFSLVGGIGMQYDMKKFLRLFVDARYIHSMLNIAQDNENALVITDWKNRSIQLSAGFMFVVGKGSL